MGEKGDLVKLALARKREGRYQEAEEVFRQGLHHFPADPYMTCGLADLYLTLNRLSEAEELVAGVIEQNPTYRPALLVLGNLHMKRNQYPEAIEFFTAAHQQKQDHYSMVRLAEAYLRGGQLAEALDLVKRGLEEQPNSLSLLRLLARALEKQGNGEGAATAYRQLLALAPKDKFAYQRLLQLESQDRPPGEVVQEVGRLLSVGERKDNPHLHAWRAKELKELGHLDEALAAYRRARELDPANLFLQKQEAFCLYRMGRWFEAMNLFQEAFRRDPRDHVVKKSLVTTWRRLDWPPEVGSYLQELLGEHPDYKPLYALLRQYKKETSTEG